MNGPTSVIEKQANIILMLSFAGEASMNSSRQSDKKENELTDKLNVCERELRVAGNQLEQKAQELSLLRRLVDISGKVFNPDRFYKSFAEIILEETQAMSCALLTRDVTTGALALKIAMGRKDDGTRFEYPLDSEDSFLTGEGVAGDVVKSFEPVYIIDTSQDPRFKSGESRFRYGSMICLPLFYQDVLLGVVNISYAGPDSLSDNKKRLMELLCGIAGTIMGNALDHLEAEKRFRSMSVELPFGMVVLDPADKKIIDCNQYTEMFLGYTRAELAEKKDVYDIVPEDYLEMMQDMLSGCGETAGHEFYETAFIEKGGNVKVCEINYRLVSYLNREVVRLTIRDISEKKRLTEKLLQSEKLRSLGELASGVAHDFNNVLAAILGRVQLMRMSRDEIPDCDDVKREGNALNLEKNLDIIEKAALDGAETVRRIQEFAGSHDDSRMDAAVNIAGVIDDAFEFTRARWEDMFESQANVIKIIREKQGSEVVTGNAAELREVFVNLINNAVDAMPHGGQITVSSMVTGNDVIIQFEDTGEGIDEEIIDKIFDPFFTTKDVGSTGLGLSVTYGVVRRHGGTIEVVSGQGAGACFVIRLPSCKNAAADIVTEPHGIAQWKRRVLVIEDERIVGDTICDILQFAGYEVILCENGMDGISEFKRKRFDLVITDLGMPGMSGFEVAAAIKEMSNRTPVMMITGWKLQLDINELREQGIDFLISKPFQVEQVVNAVQEAIQGGALSRS